MRFFKAPRPANLPHFSYIIDDLHASHDQIARHLKISPATLAKYIKTGYVPRPVHLALFWESRWGLSILDCDIWNRETLRLQSIRGLEKSNAALKRQMAQLIATGHFGAANDPLFVDGVAFVDRHHGNLQHATFKLHNQPQLPDAVAVIPGKWPSQAVPTACRVFQLRAL